jgi:hypothetical protein
MSILRRALSRLTNGALVAQVPNEGVAGGAARGQNAVDWQQLRTVAAHVASGANSVIAGGATNTASGSHSTVGGGQTNSADGLWSWTPGGANASARGQTGRGAWASGRFAANGDAQAGEMVLRRQTTDAVPFNLTSDGAAPGTANQIVLPNFGNAAGTLWIVAKDTTTNTKHFWLFHFLLRRDASAAATNVTATHGVSGSPVQGQAVAPLITAGALAPTVTLNADTVNGGLQILVTGVAATNISWVARASFVEVMA